MPKIELVTQIKAPKHIVFDLSRSIDLHKLSIAHTNETAIAGKTSGLIKLNESVTWRAKHFGIYQKLTSKVTAFERPNYFVDEMVSGAFNSFKHEHHFVDLFGLTLMTDIFYFESPHGIFGQMANKLFLTSYMTNLLKIRNHTIKNFAETDRWKDVLKYNDGEDLN